MQVTTDVEELFASSPPVRDASDLAGAGIFEDDELDEFVADLYSTRRVDVA